MSNQGDAISLSEAQAFCRQVDVLFETVSKDLCAVSNLHYTHGRTGEQGLPDLEACANHARSRMEQIAAKREQIARLTKLHAESAAAKELLAMRSEFLEVNKPYVDYPEYEFLINERWFRTRNAQIIYEDILELVPEEDRAAIRFVTYGSRKHGSGRLNKGDIVPLDHTSPTHFVVKS